MARSSSKYPTTGELAILKVLWEHGPSCLSFICDHLDGERKPAPSTVATMLKIMKGKGSVKRVSLGSGVVWNAILTRQEVGSVMLQSLVDRFFEGSAPKLVSQLLENGQLSHEDREAILKILSGSLTK
jgi:BlaI family transcriptional regulator, penicillinase repressor